MKSLVFIGFVLLTLSGVLGISDDYESPHTKVFATTKYHEVPEFNTNAKAGLGAGFAVFSVAFIFALVTIVIEEVEKHKEYDAKAIAAHKRMNELEVNVAEADAEYDEIMKAKGK